VETPKKQRQNRSLEVTERRPRGHLRVVSSGRGVREGAKLANASQGAPARPISFYGGPDATDKTLAEHCSVSGHADMAVRSEVREDRTLACVRSRCTRRVWSTFSRSGPSLESTRR
jgi:hypothetical protein